MCNMRIFCALFAGQADEHMLGPVRTRPRNAPWFCQPGQLSGLLAAPCTAPGYGHSPATPRHPSCRTLNPGIANHPTVLYSYSRGSEAEIAWTSKTSPLAPPIVTQSSTRTNVCAVAIRRTFYIPRPPIARAPTLLNFSKPIRPPSSALFKMLYLEIRPISGPRSPIMCAAVAAPRLAPCEFTPDRDKYIPTRTPPGRADPGPPRVPGRPPIGAVRTANKGRCAAPFHPRQLPLNSLGKLAVWE